MELEVFDAADWGSEVGRRLTAAVAPGSRVRLCLPTGSTPVPAYAEFVGSGGSLEDTEVFLLDEFGLPKNHPARCDAMIRRTFLDRLAAPPAALHSLDPDAADLRAECTRYEASLAAGGLDMTLLGLGGNGHVGLNEPGSVADSRTRRVDLAEETVVHAAGYGGGPAPSWGLTMGIATILESRELWLLVTGAHKAEILARTLQGEIGPEVPASFLRVHPNLAVLADDAAAVRLG